MRPPPDVIELEHHADLATRRWAAVVEEGIFRLVRSPAMGLGLLVVIVASLAPASVRAVSLPTGFILENAVPGVAFDTPTSIAFLPDGRLLVSEKQGNVWIVANGSKLATPFWSRTDEVLNQGDSGLLDVGVDPNFLTNRYVYFLYTVDPDTNGVDAQTAAFGRLARYQVSAADPNVVDYSTRAILLGRTWAEGPPTGSLTHGVGSLRWGADGSLLVSMGEGAEYVSRDPGGRDPDLFLSGRTDPYEDIGAFRAQYIGSLGGKILRINPADGLGYPSNPFYDGNPASVKSRVWAYGLRNPFRMCVRPGSGSSDPAVGHPGTIYLGDVGWDWWEEFDVATQGGRNFGWPCYEGTHNNQDYINASPAHYDCSTIITGNPSLHTPPLSDWNHENASQSFPIAISGNCAIGSVFYNGTSYPSTYQGAYFYADYGQNWLRAARMSASDAVSQYMPFGTAMDSPVDVVPNPINDDLYYVSISTGEVRRIRYVGVANQPPAAVISATPTSGPVPLTVAFSSAGSSDPNGDPLGFSWSFGDQSGSFATNPTHVYANPGTYVAKLTVSDGHGGSDVKSVQIQVGAGNTPPVAAIVAPVDNTFYVEGSPVILTGSGTDAEQSSATLLYHWDVTLHHNNHTHPDTYVSDLQNDSFVPQTHEDGTGTWLETKLTVTDNGNLSNTTSVSLWPETDLQPTAVTVTPDPAQRIDYDHLQFDLQNHGRVLARTTHWMVVAGTTVLAEGDTLVGPLGSVTIARDPLVSLTPGTYWLRAVADTFGVMHETDETNNASTRPLDVVSGATGVEASAGALGLSAVTPNPANGTATVFLQLPKAARVSVVVHDVLGREVWSAPRREYVAGRWPLHWNASGAAAGVYLLRVQVGDVSWVRRVAVVR
jgi:glucose/arabinose dehydrogenase